MSGVQTRAALALDVASREFPMSEMSDPSIPPQAQIAQPSLLWHARWTVPLHVILPIGLSWLMRHDFDAAVTTFAGIHVGFPLLLLMTVRWWWSRTGELLLLLFINHIVSFVVLCFIQW